jgi:hypothetical protein
MTLAGRPALLGLHGLLLIALGVSACRKPAPVDPAEAAFHEVVTRFAEVSKLTKDLSYRDARFDPILGALDQIRAESEAKPRALALAERIRAARALASSQERSSELLQAQAEAPPAFEPQARLPPPAATKRTTAIDAPPASSEQGYAEPVSGGPVATAPGHRLPSWYAGYFGTDDKIQDAGASEPDATAVNAPPSKPARKESGKGARSVAPPPVFGLPGPAGSALLGRPGNE